MSKNNLEGEEGGESGTRNCPKGGGGDEMTKKKAAFYLQESFFSKLGRVTQREFLIWAKSGKRQRPISEPATNCDSCFLTENFLLMMKGNGGDYAEKEKVLFLRNFC